MKYRSGFTVIEVLAVSAFLAVALALFLTQKINVDAAVRDSQRKTSVNAIHYNLEEVYYKKSGYYPDRLTNGTLSALNPELLEDPDGHQIDDVNSSIRYESNDCSLDGKCQGYTLRAELEAEAEYVKSSQSHDD